MVDPFGWCLKGNQKDTNHSRGTPDGPNLSSKERCKSAEMEWPSREDDQQSSQTNGCLTTKTPSTR